MATLTIADVLLKEPDRPLSFYSFGPRIFVSIQDLAALDLLQKGSRIRYVNLLKVHDQSELNRIAGDLKTVADGVQERVDTFRTARSGIKRFFDNFLFFLSLIGMFTLLLAGIGIHSALTAYLKEKEKTIAIMKTVGATSRFIISCRCSWANSFPAR
jgi:putative ABC transport system permease protein